MDNKNERMIFQALVDTAEDSKTQYFIITPKLLRHLPYSNKMKVSVVHNGVNFGDKPKDKFDFKLAIQGYQSIAV